MEATKIYGQLVQKELHEVGWLAIPYGASPPFGPVTAVAVSHKNHSSCSR